MSSRRRVSLNEHFENDPGIEEWHNREYQARLAMRTIAIPKPWGFLHVSRIDSSGHPQLRGEPHVIVYRPSGYRPQTEEFGFASRTVPVTDGDYEAAYRVLDQRVAEALDELRTTLTSVSHSQQYGDPLGH